MKDRAPRLALDQEDMEHVQSIVYEVGHEVGWGALAEEIVEYISERFQEMISIGEGTSSPLGDLLFPASQDFLCGEPGGDERVQLVCMYLAKKALGAAKTRLNQKISQAFDMTDGFSEEEEDFSAEADTILEIETDQEVREHDELENLEHLRDISRLRRALKEGREVQPNDMVEEIEARLNLNSGFLCKHTRTRITCTANTTERWCMDCKAVLPSIELGRRQGKQGKQYRQQGRQQLPKRPCAHGKVLWAKGLEGKQAVCSDCKKVVDNPETYQWASVGLEPFGDDPSLDSVIDL